MKHLRLFENKAAHYMKDYHGDDVETKLYKDLEMLKKYHIPYNLYYYIPFDVGYFSGKLFFKIYNFSSLSYKEEEILEKFNFMIVQGGYEFTWDWKIIKDEEDISLLINANKYNL